MISPAHRSFLMAVGTLALAGCVNLPANRDAGSSDNPALPQPSGSQPTEPPAPAAKPSPKPVAATADLPATDTPPPPSAATQARLAAANTYDEQAPAGMTFDNIEIIGVSLKGKLTVQRVGSGHTELNLLSVFAGLNNRTGKELRIEVQTIYKDKTDTPITGGTASWVPLTLKPHEQVQYRSVAISADATDFMIRVRSAANP